MRTIKKAKNLTKKTGLHLKGVIEKPDFLTANSMMS